MSTSRLALRCACGCIAGGCGLLFCMGAGRAPAPSAEIVTRVAVIRPTETDLRKPVEVLPLMPAPAIEQPTPDDLPPSYTSKPQVAVDGLQVAQVEIVAPVADPAAGGRMMMRANRAWGPEQAVGAPNTNEAGDIQTAWASLTPDAQAEWIICSYAEAIDPRAILIHETFNPGAVVKVTAFDANDKEVIAWEGVDPTPRDVPKGVSVIPIKLNFKTKKIKIYVDSPAVPGWNEIDAVGLRDAAGETAWAVAVEASTTYAVQADRAIAVRPAPIPNGKRNWGPEQVTGAPDTEGFGDIITAWASSSQDDQPEWLVCQYRNAVDLREIVIHETYNPGAVTKVTAFDDQGKESVVWEGVDPTPRDSDRGISVIPAKIKFKTKKIKIYVDSPAVPGWNEIDAVGLRDTAGELQWAQNVEASSTYAQGRVVDPLPVDLQRLADQQRIAQLEQELQAVRKEVDRLKQIEADVQEIKRLLKDRK